jgi:hypothetical protein
MHMNLQDKIKLGVEALEDFKDIRRIDLSNAGTRKMIVQHIFHYIEYINLSIPKGKDDKKHIA